MPKYDSSFKLYILLLPQVYQCSGEFQFSFGGNHAGPKELNHPSGLTVDEQDNIIVADYGNGCVKLFSPEGKFIKSIVKYPQNVGAEQVVRPLNVALADKDKLLVLIRGSHFAQIQVFEYDISVFKPDTKSSVLCAIS